MASMVTTGGILADIGTDHAYVPIALVQRQKIKGAIAMDINEGPLARAQEHIRAARLEEVLGTLTEREQKVLTLRFGLEDGRARTLEEVGKEFNVTRERIRQIEAKALRKLRHPSRSRKLKDYLE